MSILIWSQRPDIEAWHAARSDGAVYQVLVDAGADPYARFAAMIFEPGKEMRIIGGARMRKTAQAICAQDCDESGIKAAVEPIPDRDWPDNYAIPAYEPTGDEEYDRRARGRVESDGE